MQLYGAGVLDGDALVAMNNLAVGYFPSETAELGVYPPPVVIQPTQPLPAPGDVAQNSEMNS